LATSRFPGGAVGTRGSREAGRCIRVAMPMAPRSAALHHVRMKNLSWIPLALAALSGISVLCAGCSASGGGDSPTASEPSPSCGPTPDAGGGPCSCPGASICGFMCLEDGTWEKNDLSCVLGLHCRASTECASGQACCGDPYTGWWGTQISSSSCQPAPCSSDTLQLCKSSDECVQPGFGCGMVDLAFPADASVLTCAAGVGIDDERHPLPDGGVADAMGGQ
jgi:hypothetical protein